MAIGKPVETDTLKSQNPLNIEALMQRCLGETEFAVSIVEQFLGNLNSDYEILCQLAAERAFSGLAKEAHRIKGTAATVGAEPLTAMLSQVESIAGESASSGIEAKLNEIETEISRLNEFVATNLR